ncbi:hypothetical protein OPT61_g3078 [Boeremia exigua]|uniref:Uncharacterized protein n=1 Tax=Boeremia exigua TaxID=749465 RepID=A0ACC2IJC2_9PLEO|nr:hypothetical protein OPT61_g3078 [Boeremia exigua]
MKQLQIKGRYYSRDGLLAFLRSRFGDHLDFKIKETKDGNFTFEAPEDLTPHKHDAWTLISPVSALRSSVLQNEQQFTTAKGNHLVELIRFEPTTPCNSDIQAFKNAFQLSDYLRSSSPVRKDQLASFEIYFLHQQDTWSPINASADMISLFMDYYKLSPGFLHILSSFRDRYLATEEGFTGPSRSTMANGSAEFGWIYKYAEKKPVKYGDPWRIRHTGLYHVYNHKEARTTVFVINPSPNACFKSHLQQVMKEASARIAILRSPVSIHAMLISLHLHSWREYLEYQETLLLKLDTKSACNSFEQPSVNFDTLKEVRAVERSILPLEPLMVATDRVKVDLGEAATTLTRSSDAQDEVDSILSSAFKEFRKEVEAYRTQVLYLHRRTQATAQLVLDSLNLSFQQVADTQNKNTFSMARSAREDSVAIRAITLVTSFYLPFSFVATMFGMNLVDFDSSSHNLLVSRQFWLYFVIAIPLTAATLMCWRYKLRSYREDYLMEDTKREKRMARLEINSDIEMV